MSDLVDLAVVGAGPAGSAAALRALQLDPGARVVLVDKAAFPRDKTCGDGVGPEALEVLDRLDVRAVLDGYPPLHRVRVQGPAGGEAVGRSPRPFHVVPRRVLDARLRDAALSRGAIPVRARVRTVEPAGDRVHLDAGITARWVVAADGANSAVRRALGAPAQPPGRTGLAMRGYAVAADAPALAETMYIGFVRDRWPAYVWAFPTGTGLINVGYGPFDARQVDGRTDLVDAIHTHLADVLPDPDSLRAHRLPLSTFRPALTVGRVLLAGDAASLINPLTGEGIYYALLSGAMAGEAVARASHRAAQRYRGAMRARLGRHLRHTDVAARLFRLPRIVDLGVEAARGHPERFEQLCEFALGTGVITPRMAAGLVRRAVRAAAA